MNLDIKTLSHPSLQFNNGYPAGFSWPRLKGAEVRFCKGDFGLLCIQEYARKDFIVRYSVCSTSEDFVLQAKSLHSGMHTILMMKNRISITINNRDQVDIFQNGFTMIQAHQPEFIVRLKKNRVYVSVETLISNSFAKELLEGFPDVKFSWHDPAPVDAEVWINPSKESAEKIDEHIHDMFGYKEKENWQQDFFKNQLRDIYWRKLAIYAGRKFIAAGSKKPEEIEKAYRTQQFILDNLENLEQELSLKELSQKAITNESTLKRIFKKVFGIPIHQYIINERLKKCIFLVRQGMTVEEAAAKVGWIPNSFISAYKKEYGTTPGTIKKMK